MPMTSEAAFDVVSSEYDAQFTETIIGREQRRISRYWLEKFLSGKKKIEILEINCGTGEDALWLASFGHQIIATDESPAMIHEAKKKLPVSIEKNVDFFTCSFENLAATLPLEKFDLIFSNFAGLNCVSPEKMVALNKELYSLLKKNGHFVIVVFGKHALWETFYYLLKGSPGKAFRRWSNKKKMVRLKENVYQPVYYYSIKKLEQIFSSFHLKEKRPVGLFIPPSYLEGVMNKRPKFFESLVTLEKKTKRFAIGGSFADHTYLLFKKEEA